MSGPVSTVAGVPKKPRRTAVMAAVVGGLLLVAAVAVALFFVTRSGDDEEPVAAASTSGAAPSTAPSTAPSAAPADTPPAEAPPPPVASAAPDALVVLSCDPECDAVVCDKKPVKDPASGVRLLPGAHTCTARKPGLVATPVTFQTVAGEDGKQTITLVKAEPPKPGGKKAPCGTFVNPCP